MTSELPRFPLPFLEVLCDVLDWEDVVALASIDKREAPSRTALFAARGAVILHGARIDADLKAMFDAHPGLRSCQLGVCDANEVLPHALALHFADTVRDLANCKWPAGIKSIVFDATLLSVCTLPSCLQELRLNGPPYVLRSPHEIAWPQNLRYLRFFDSRPLASESLPRTLERLEIWGNFSHAPDGFVVPEALIELTLSRQFNHSLDLVAWNSRLEKLTFQGAKNDQGVPPVFNQRIDRVAWPDSLRHIELGDSFNQPVAGVSWPAGLETLNLGEAFNQPLRGARWPAPMRELKFGYRIHCLGTFNQPLDDVIWPPRLQELRLGRRFNQPLTNAEWPATLTQLQMGRAFNQPLAGARLPAGLKRLELSQSRFNRYLQGVAWPQGLTHLHLGRSFDQSLVGVNWPAELERIFINTPDYSQSFGGVVWPAALRRLYLESCPGIVTLCEGLPSELEHLTVGLVPDCSVAAVPWPPQLKTLVLRCDAPCRRTFCNVNWPTSLVRLVLPNSFDEPLDTFTWPSQLESLSLGCRFNQPVAGVAWPPRLKYLSLGMSFDRPLEGVVWPASLTWLSLGPGQALAPESSWPPGLQTVSYRGDYLGPRTQAQVPPTVSTIEMWDPSANLCPAHFEWPARLKRIKGARGVVVGRRTRTVCRCP
jgi:hypothetical protein